MLKRVLSALRGRDNRREGTPEPEDGLKRLGYQRRRLLSCVAGPRGSVPKFAPLPDVDVLVAYHLYVAQVMDSLGGYVDDPAGPPLIAALRLLAGDIDAADAIIDALPVEPIVLDHGAGYCLVAPYDALASALPLPEDLKKHPRVWTRGSIAEKRLRDWLAACRERLIWDDVTAAYRLEAASRSP